MWLIRRTSLLSGCIALCIQLWSLTVLAQNTSPDLCVSINTSSGESTYNMYQSFGECRLTCEDYAYAIVQEFYCWCSNYAPDEDTIVDNDECDTQCPGYTEWCGGDDLFGYLEMGTEPSGTLGADDSDTKTTTTTTEPNTDMEPTPVETFTADGTVRTVFITPTSSSDLANTNGTTSDGNSTAKIVGIVVGVAVGIVLIMGIACFFKIRRKKRDEQGPFEVQSATGISGGMSQAKGSGGFMMTRGAAGENSLGAGAANRRSMLMPVDPRMDPATTPPLYVRNKSQESLQTLHDEHDYSRKVHQPRVLRAVNPDPDT